MAKNNFSAPGGSASGGKILFIFITAVFLTLGLSISFQSLLAASTWRAPLANPPACEPGNPGCDEPINRGILSQSKRGPLTVNYDNDAATGFVAYGNVGIGTTSPLYDLHVYDSQTGADASIIAVDGVANAQVGYDILKNGVLRWQMLVSDDGTEDLRFWEGDDKYGFGAQKNQVVFKAGGNVGIGTMYPVYKLTVNSSNNTDNLLQVATTTNQGIMVINNNGNVGIGTATPNGQLTIVSPTPNRGTIEVFNVPVGGNNDIRFDGGNDSLFAFWNYGPDSNGATFFRSTTVDPILYLKNNGNVGIGTTIPYSKLSVWGSGTGATSIFELTNSASTTLMTVLNNGNVGIGRNDSQYWYPLTVLGNGSSLPGSPTFKNVAVFDDASFSRGILLGYDSGATNVGLIAADIGSDFPFSLSSNLGFIIHNGTGYVEAMRITSLGNVGIGTTNPGAKLDVMGQIKSTMARAQFSTSGDWSTASTTWVNTDAIVTTTTTGGPLLLIFNTQAITNTASALIGLRFTIDGTPVTTAAMGNAVVQNPPGTGAYQQTPAMTWLATGIAAGSHTIRVQVRVSSGIGYIGETSASEGSERTLIVIEL